MISRRNLIRGTILATASTAVLSACGLGGTSSSSGKGGDAGKPTAFTIYTARDKALAESVVADFEKANPNWEGMATILTLGAQEALERVRAEKANPQGDIWWGGTRQQLSAAAADGVLAPAPQDIIDAVPEESRDKDGLWIGEMKLAELFMINTDVMSKDKAPKDWDDLLGADMKDNLIIRDVEASGTMRSIYCAMIDRADPKAPEAGYEWLKKLDANTKAYAANPTDLYQRLSRQEAPLSLWNLQDIMLQHYGDFSMLDAVVPESGAPMLIDGLAKIKDGPGSAGADKFISFLMSEGEQKKLAEEQYQIPTVELSDEPKWLAELGLKEMEVDWDRVAENESDWIGYWAQNIKGKG
ncbi:extracellular solute-binding protein [Helcobacillus massiliensis]|uniref:Iron(III) transport system substrate-binding protein n=1 Tax=Helcobacillus massiliensis TaxID=521392 RepID=A0A839R170_9MICO|nr:extracellular solute-binding protein [Helcobacillus massiliensis]MBB3023597.1 iron(III) transport system substrate-binding protein [Helcobacillus massiliensis]